MHYKASAPEGFEERINYGMIGYCVPHSIYQNGYHSGIFVDENL